ncbi:MAG: NYN domain-containing protein, partial [Actinobacteria bacterium]|nr:NYN domain-containing protein [Actinomycetota bacterium]
VDLRALTASHAVALGAADALADALAELGRHLAPLLGTAEEKARDTAPSSPRSSPPPRSRRPVALPPAILDDSVEAAEHLLRVDGVIVLVDGYNLTKRARPELALADQRRWLVDASVETATRTGARFEVVFDGADDRERAPADLHRRSGVQVRFSPTGTEADDVVVQRAEALAGEPVVVASDDRRVRDGAQRVGANVVGAAQLLAAMKRPLGR